eukprot:m.23649 g.23649  ORF g.23649 m.23649 type:complete len:173 (+) comp28509_c0_seq3:103-621(+)
MGFAGSYRTLLFLPLAASLFTEVAVAIRHHHTVFRSDFPVHALHRRRRDVSGNDTTSSEWPTETTVVNAIPGNENVTVVFPGRTFAGLSYGASQRGSVVFQESDNFTILVDDRKDLIRRDDQRIRISGNSGKDGRLCVFVGLCWGFLFPRLEFLCLPLRRCAFYDDDITRVG